MTAEEVVTGYVAAVNGTLHIIRFGAMMMVLDTVLACENGAKTTDPGYGGGLRAWLASNVPDVNYKTAMRMKGTAETVCAGLGAEPSALLRCLNPDPKALPDEEDAEALVALRERLVEIVHGKSERSLVLWLKGGAPAAPDGKDAEDAGKADEIALDAARKFAHSVCHALDAMDARKKTALRKAMAQELRKHFGSKRLGFLAQLVEEALEA